MALETTQRTCLGRGLDTPLRGTRPTAEVGAVRSGAAEGSCVRKQTPTENVGPRSRGERRGLDTRLRGTRPTAD